MLVVVEFWGGAPRTPPSFGFSLTMTLQLKTLLTIVLSAIIALFCGALVRAIYEKLRILPLVAGLAIAVLAQIMIALRKSRDEEELDLLREMRLTENRQRIREAEALSTKIEEEIRNGNYESVVEITSLKERLWRR